MVFFLAIIITILIAVAYGHSKRDYIVGGVLGFAVGYAIYSTALFLLPVETTTDTSHYQLEAINTGVHKGYYLTVDEPKGIAVYAIQENGETKIVTGKHDLGIIVQDGKKELTVEVTTKKNHWLKPWNISTRTQHEFHIPEGSYKPM